MRNFSIIVAMDQKQGIGQSNALAWHLPADLKHFKTITTTVFDPQCQNAVVMGRKTWESLPQKVRPLPGRLNVVISRQKDFPVPSGVNLGASLDEILQDIDNKEDIENIFVIGGAKLYQDAIVHPNCEKLYITEIQDIYKCDAFFPEIPKIFQKISVTTTFSELKMAYRFALYQKIGYTLNR